MHGNTTTWENSRVVAIPQNEIAAAAQRAIAEKRRFLTFDKLISPGIAWILGNSESNGKALPIGTEDEAETAHNTRAVPAGSWVDAWRSIELIVRFWPSTRRRLEPS